MKKKFFVFLFLIAFVLSFFVTAMFCVLFLRLNRAIESCNYENEEVFGEIYEEPEQIEVEQEPEKEEQKLVSLGDFRLTAYCSCQKCCGYWATVRPVDENGKEIVFGSSGEVLNAGVSVAVDTNVIPYGSELLINGTKYIAHGTCSGINGYCIDVYHDDHQKAVEFGLQYAEVFLVEE